MIKRTYGFKREESAIVLGEGRNTFLGVEVQLPKAGDYDISETVIKTGGLRHEIDMLEGTIKVSDMTLTLDNSKQQYNIKGVIKANNESILGRPITIKFGFNLIPNEMIKIFTGTVESIKKTDGSTISVRLRSTMYNYFKRNVLKLWLGNLIPISYKAQHCIDIIKDIILNRMNVPLTSVDIESMEGLRTILPYAFEFEINNQTEGIAFIENEILSVIGGWLTVNEEGILKLDLIRPQFGKVEDYVIDDKVNVIKREEEVRLADIQNVFSFRYRDLDGKTREYMYRDETSIEKYNREKIKSINAEAIVSSLGGLRNIALRLSLHYGELLINGEYDVKLDLIACQVGDVIKDGTTYWMIIGFKKMLDSGIITLDVTDVTNIYSTSNWAFLGSEQNEGDGISPQPDDYVNATVGHRAFCYIANASDGHVKVAY